MRQTRLALINDFTGFGRCSVTIELPILSALKIQVCPLPTAILSVHTGFDNYFLDDFTDRMNAYINSWAQNKLMFDAVATGFLGSADQIEIVKNFIEQSDAQIMIDRKNLCVVHKKNVRRNARAAVERRSRHTEFDGGV